MRCGVMCASGLFVAFFFHFLSLKIISSSSVLLRFFSAGWHIIMTAGVGGHDVMIVHSSMVQR